MKGEIPTTKKTSFPSQSLRLHSHMYHPSHRQPNCLCSNTKPIDTTTTLFFSRLPFPSGVKRKTRYGLQQGGKAAEMAAYHPMFRPSHEFPRPPQGRTQKEFLFHLMYCTTGASFFFLGRGFVMYRLREEFFFIFWSELVWLLNLDGFAGNSERDSSFGRGGEGWDKMVWFRQGV